MNSAAHQDHQVPLPLFQSDSKPYTCLVPEACTFDLRTSIAFPEEISPVVRTTAQLVAAKFCAVGHQGYVTPCTKRAELDHACWIRVVDELDFK